MGEDGCLFILGRGNNGCCKSASGTALGSTTIRKAAFEERLGNKRESQRMVYWAERDIVFCRRVGSQRVMTE